MRVAAVFGASTRSVTVSVWASPSANVEPLIVVGTNATGTSRKSWDASLGALMAMRTDRVRPGCSTNDFGLKVNQSA